DINAIVNNPNFKSIIDDVSPITHVTTSSPRTILLHGKEDTLVDYSIAQDLAAELQKYNVTYDFITLDHSGHSLDNTDDTAQIKQFEDKVLEVISNL
ncbi:MAG: prolyl oligopeptidase family serine peptidase, partial [Spirochaetales bacterium]|nr:prolyl oligopeptidase family serine peptidase [Spirochaetales bacterium]